MNVEQFLQIVDESKSIVERAEKGEFTLADEVRLTRKVVGLAIPTMTEEEINKLDVSQIQAIAEFAKGNDVEGVEEVSSEETQEDPEESRSIGNRFWLHLLPNHALLFNEL